MKNLHIVSFLLTIVLIVQPVRASPSLDVTVSTDKKSYLLGESINAYGNLTYDGKPVEGLVALWVSDPDNNPVVARTSKTGIYAVSDPYLKIYKVYSCDYLGNPQDNYTKGVDPFFHINASIINTNLDLTYVYNVTVCINIYDANGVSIGLFFSQFLALGNNSIYSVFFSLPIPTWIPLGSASAFVSTYSDFPSLGGFPYSLENSTTFEVVSAGTSELWATETNVQTIPTITQTTGTYSQTFKLSPEAKLGTYTIYATGSYGMGNVAPAKDTKFDLAKQTTYPITVGQTTYNVATVSNSSITNFAFTPLAQGGGEISFNATGPIGTIGFCNITIPLDFMWGDFKVFVDGEPPLYLLQSPGNGTHTSLYFTYQHTTHKIQVISTEVVPEFPASMVPLLFIIISLTTVIIAKAWSKKRRELPKTL